MGTDGSLKFDTEINESGFNSGIKGIGSKLKGMASAGKTALGVFGGNLLTKFFDAGTSAVGNLVGELNSSSKAWQTFEGNMKNFGKSGSQIAKVKGDLQQFAQETIYSASDMASTYAQLSAVGTKNTTALVKGFGGLAAAAENPQQAMKTLSQQATQMAAKPTVQWSDFKLMLEQTPAGIAAVSKEMGMSTQEMIQAVQDGKVETDAFFNAITKAGGAGSSFEKMATSYKTVDQAMDGLVEGITNQLQPAFDDLNKIGISAIEGLSGALDGMNIGDLASKATGALSGLVDAFKEGGVGGLYEAGTEMMANLINGISAQVPNLIPKGLEIILSLVQSFLSNAPTLLNAGLNLMQSVAQGIANSIPILIAKVPEIIGQFLSGFGQFLANALTTGRNIITTLANGIRAAAPQAKAALIQGGKAAIAAFKAIPWAAVGKTVITFLKNAIVGAGSLILGALKTIGTAALNAFRSINWASVGKAAVNFIKNAVTGAGGLLLSALKSIGTKAMNGFKSINWLSLGKNIVTGIVKGVGSAAGALFSKLRGLASNALSAAKKALGINSPSKVFAKVVGRAIPEGIVKGIGQAETSIYKKLSNVAKKASTSMSAYIRANKLEDAGKAVISNMSGTLDTQEKTSNNKVSKSISKSMDKAKKAYSKAIKKTSGNNKKELQKSFKEDTKAFASVSKKIIKQYKTSLGSALATLENQTSSKITAIGSKYQKLLDDLTSKQSNMLNMLREPANLYDLDAQIQSIERYQKNLNSLKGKIPQSLMEEVLGMDMAAASNFGEYLNALSADELAAYIQKWNEIQNKAAGYSSNFFAADIASTKESYQKEINAVLKDATAKSKEIGSQVANGIVQGLTSNMKGLSKAAKKATKALISSFKSALKIKSPSRVMGDEIGAYLMPGITWKMEKTVPKAAKDMTESVLSAVNTVQRNISGLESGIASTVTGPAGAPPVINVQNAPTVVNAEIHTTVDLDGRTVGKSVTPYVNQELSNIQRREERGS